MRDSLEVRMNRGSIILKMLIFFALVLFSLVVASVQQEGRSCLVLKDAIITFARSPICADKKDIVICMQPATNTHAELAKLQYFPTQTGFQKGSMFEFLRTFRNLGYCSSNSPTPFWDVQATFLRILKEAKVDAELTSNSHQGWSGLLNTVQVVYNMFPTLIGSTELVCNDDAYTFLIFLLVHYKLNYDDLKQPKPADEENKPNSLKRKLPSKKRSSKKRKQIPESALLVNVDKPENERGAESQKQSNHVQSSLGFWSVLFDPFGNLPSNCNQAAVSKQTSSEIPDNLPRPDTSASIIVIGRGEGPLAQEQTSAPKRKLSPRITRSKTLKKREKEIQEIAPEKTAASLEASFFLNRDETLTLVPNCVNTAPSSAVSFEAPQVTDLLESGQNEHEWDRSRFIDYTLSEYHLAEDDYIIESVVPNDTADDELKFSAEQIPQQWILDEIDKYFSSDF